MVPVYPVDTDLFRWYAHMRQTAPVSYDGPSGAWMVFRYQDVEHVLSDYRVFSSRIPFPPEQTDFTQSLNFVDPPRHRSLRSLVQQAFTPARVAALAPRIREIADTLVSNIGSSQRFDFMRDFAVPLPVTVIAELLGVPLEDRAAFKGWSDGIVMLDPEAPTALASYFRDLIAARRSTPRDDLITALIGAHDDGGVLSEQELVDFCMVLLVGGNETTTNLLGNTLVTLDEHLEVRTLLAAEPALIPDALEEVLRFRSPVQNMTRVTRADAQLGEVTIPAGQVVTAWIGSANRDEAQFDQPDTFIPDRRPNRHLAFGTGIHFCLGAPLARLEGRIGIEVVVRAWPDLRVERDQGLEMLPGRDFWGLRRLIVRP